MTDKTINSDNEKIYGPVLPKNFKKFTDNIKEDNQDDSGDEVYGPILPTSFTQPKKPVIGPNLPKKSLTSNYSKPIEKRNEINDNEDDQDNEPIIGPLPGQIDVNHMFNQPELIKKESTGPKREKWMLEPGKSLSKTLLPTRSVTKFNQKIDKEKPLTEEEKLEIEAKKKKEQTMNEFLEKYDETNKRSISLLEMHRQEMKKTKKTKTTIAERKEFDRERDLCAPRMDSKLKKSLIKNASTTFGTRFSSGKFEKFL